jgi:hypothetical protein
VFNIFSSCVLYRRTKENKNTNEKKINGFTDLVALSRRTREKKRRRTKNRTRREKDRRKRTKKNEKRTKNKAQRVRGPGCTQAAGQAASRRHTSDNPPRLRHTWSTHTSESERERVGV